jgi:pyruvate formate lyase activating enzyme
MKLMLSRIDYLSTTAFPNRPCSVVHTATCPLRCFYCRRSVGGESVEVGLLVEHLEGGRKLVDAVAIAGCEPLAQRAALELVERLRERNFAVKLHTTGYFPEALERVLGSRLADLVEMEIKAPLDSRFAEVTGREDALDRVFQSLEVLASAEAGFRITATLAPPLFSERDVPELVDALERLGFRSPTRVGAACHASPGRALQRGVVQ